MSVPRTVAEVIHHHVTLELESLDRLYLNVYQPRLQTPKAKFCFNGHEYLKRQLAKEGIGYQELANGILQCNDPKRMQQLADRLSPRRIERFLRKWQERLPCPLRPCEQAAGYRYEVSMTQVEFALTQVVDQPVHGRIFFEEVIHENLDLGRPESIQLIFDRRVIRSTPGVFRTRVVRQGVIPSLRVDYKTNGIKQYFKEGRALRTELTVHNPADFGVGRRLEHLSALREVAFATNRRVLHVQKTSQDFVMSEALFREVTGPRVVGEQRASALRFGDPQVLALFSVLLLFRFLPCGFRSRELREHVAPLLGQDPSQWTQGRLSYQLRRLRLHGLIQTVPNSHRYTVTERGQQVALWFVRCHARLFRPALGELLRPDQSDAAILGRALAQFDKHVDRYLCRAKLPTAA